MLENDLNMIDLVLTHLNQPWGPPWTLETFGDPWRPLATLGDHWRHVWKWSFWPFSGMSRKVKICCNINVNRQICLKMSCSNQWDVICSLWCIVLSMYYIVSDRVTYWAVLTPQTLPGELKTRTYKHTRTHFTFNSWCDKVAFCTFFCLHCAQVTG